MVRWRIKVRRILAEELKAGPAIMYPKGIVCEEALPSQFWSVERNISYTNNEINGHL
jgi:hypothetical protein